MSPYNRSLATCLRMEEYLRELHDAQTTLDFFTNQPEVLAYKLREAMYAAQYHKDFLHIGKLRGKYKFLALDAKVRARWMSVDKPQMRFLDRPGPTGEARSPDSPEEAQFGDFMSRTLDTVPVPEVRELMGVLAATMKYIPANEEVYFPNAILRESELRRLYVWAKEQGLKIINNEDQGVTLTKKKVDEELVWQPDD